jgi:hypothetical protein
MDPLQLKPVNIQDFVELHKRIGLALWHSQAFEDSLSRFITLILKLPPSRAEDEVNAVLEKMFSKTLGQLVTELKKANTTNSVSEFERRMNKFLDERNWLVHHSWRQHHTDLYIPEKLPPLYQRLANLADEALKLQKIFGDLAHAWTLRQPGITPEKFEVQNRKVLKDRGVID